MTDISTAKERARQAVDAIAQDLVRISKDIHSHPELAWKEHCAYATLVPFLAEHGFAIQEHAYGIETAFRADWGQGSTTIAICAEYDALPEIGHACGHNLIAACGIGAAIAASRALDPADAHIALMGTPAEEGGAFGEGGGKILMLERGCFDGADVAIMAHPSPADFVYSTVTGSAVFDVEYVGKASHQGSSPERGLNALDAMVTAYNAVSQLRQHIRRDARLGAIITHGGDAVNIIPERTAGIFSARAATLPYLEELRERLRRCLESGALATGCEARITLRERQYAPMKTNRALADAYLENGTALGMHFIDLTGVQTGGTDMGNVSQTLPSIQPEFRIGQAGNHTREFATAAITAEAHEAMLRAAQALAMTAIDVALAPGLLQRIKREFVDASTEGNQ